MAIFFVALVGAALLLIFFRDINSDVVFFLALGILLLAAIWLAYFVLAVYLPMVKLTNRIQNLAAGDLESDSKIPRAEAFRSIYESLKMHRERLNQIIAMTEAISSGKEHFDFKAGGEDDQLGKAVLRMRANILKLNIEVKKRRKLDEQENWAAAGLAKFANLFRDEGDHTAEFSDIFARELCTYLDTEVATLFLLAGSGDEVIYKLSGSHAINHEILLNPEFKPGEGLVGRCASDKKILVIHDVPEDYIRIRSGLGEAKPATIILVPLVFDGQVLGVIEVATFQIVKKYKIEFLQSLADSMAIYLSKTRTS